MTKKDYQALAGALYRVSQPKYGTSAAEEDDIRGGMLSEVIDAVSDVLAADNPRFHRETFVTACETGDVTRRPKRKQTPAPDGETPLTERLAMAKRKRPPTTAEELIHGRAGAALRAEANRQAAEMFEDHCSRHAEPAKGGKS